MDEPTPNPIVWEPPPPRAGLLHAWDTFIGPGATRGETRLILLAGVGGVLVALGAARRAGVAWSPWQWLLALAMALDMFGGAVANATSATKRWYHRPGQGPGQHLVFVAVHVYPFLVAWLYRGHDWGYGLLIYGYLLLATLILLGTPLYLKRPMALTLYLLGLAIPWLLLSPTPGLVWFVPLLYLKLIVCHLVPEAPFRPGAAKPG